MEIRFSKHVANPPEVVAIICEQEGFHHRLASMGENFVRFSLPGVSVEGHDKVIRALLDLDPHATIRTARAVFEGRRDYKAQLNARNK